MTEWTDIIIGNLYLGETCRESLVAGGEQELDQEEREDAELEG